MDRLALIRKRARALGLRIRKADPDEPAAVSIAEQGPRRPSIVWRSARVEVPREVEVANPNSAPPLPKPTPVPPPGTAK